MSSSRLGLAAGAVLTLAFALPAAADPAASGRTLRVAVDKAEVVTLDSTPSVVLVANPQIADVVVERNNLLFVLGRRPGETRLYVYGEGGKRLLEREIVVVPGGERTVTIVRTTQVRDYSCDPRCIGLGANETPAAPVSPPPAAPAP